MTSQNRLLRTTKELEERFYIGDAETLNQMLEMFSESERNYFSFLVPGTITQEYWNVPYTKIIFVEQGELEVEVNGVNLTMTPENILFINAHSDVRLHPANEDTLYYNVYMKRQFFNSKFMKRLAMNETFYNFITFCLMGREDNKVHLLFGNSCPLIQQAFFTLLVSVLEDDLSGVEEALLFFLTVVTSSKKCTLISSFSTEINPTIVTSMLTYITSHHGDVTLNGLSHHFSYHPNYISRLIRQETGKTFQEHVQAEKLRKAEDLLLNSNALIKDIALDLGYSDTSYFNKIFKEEYRCTPTQYRSHSKQFK